MTRGRGVVWLLPLAAALHDGEEALTFAHYLPTIRAHAPSFARSFVDAVTPRAMLIALAIVTVLPIAIVAWAQWKPASRAAWWCVLLVAAVFLLNVVSHATSAVVLRGYTPGLVTALAINLPVCALVLRRGVRERWVSGRAVVALVPAVVFVHGPLLILLLLGVRRFR